MPTTFEHSKILPTTFDKNPCLYIGTTIQPRFEFVTIICMLTNMPMTVTCQCLMPIPKNALGQDVPTTAAVEMPTNFEHENAFPTTF